MNASPRVGGVVTSLYGNGLGFTHYSPAATPEPATWLALGGGALALLRRRKSRQ